MSPANSRARGRLVAAPTLSMDNTVGAATEQGRGEETTAFECTGLYLEYGSGTRAARRVLDEVNFSVRTGEFVSLVGESGVGKTTLLRVLGGLAPVANECGVFYNGQRVVGPPPGVVTVFQDYAASLLPWRTVERNVSLGVERHLPKGDVATRVDQALDMVGLTRFRRDHPWQLSGGMQQRVQLARALVTQPSVLLMDEPFGSLDAMTKWHLQDSLQLIHQQTNTTVVFVTHDIEEAVYLSDRVIVLAGSPARISREIDVALPRPRHQVSTKESPDYLELRHDVFDAIGGSAHDFR